MPTQKILQNTTFNFKLSIEKRKKGDDGYKWCPEINMYFQNKDAKGSIREIIKMIEITKYNIELSIKLDSEKLVKYVSP